MALVYSGSHMAMLRSIWAKYTYLLQMVRKMLNLKKNYNTEMKLFCLLLLGRRIYWIKYICLVQNTKSPNFITAWNNCIVLKHLELFAYTWRYSHISKRCFSISTRSMSQMGYIWHWHYKYNLWLANVSHIRWQTMGHLLTKFVNVN